MTVSNNQYSELLSILREKIEMSRLRAMRYVNTTHIELYWKIGEQIALRQEMLGWGRSVVDKLSKDLKNTFPKTKGYSAANLWRMRNFFLKYRHLPNLAQLVREIGWGHNIAIMEKCKSESESEFYIRMTAKFGWSRSVLCNQIESRAFEKYLLGQTNFDQTVPSELKDQALLAIKDNYSFDFLGLSESHSERELESKLLMQIRQFLLEMGGQFAFIGNQYRLLVDGDEFHIDLLLFHRKLRSLFAVELKIVKFKPEHSGRLQFYLTALDKQVKLPGENPSIGLLICKEKNRTVVEYALKSSDNPIGVATYNITNGLPENLEEFLPSSEAISKRLSSI